MDIILLPRIRFCLYLLLEGTRAIVVVMNTDVTTPIGTSNVVLKCHFEPVTGDLIYGIGLQAKNKTTDYYVLVAAFYPANRNVKARLSSSGQYLAGRVSLTNPTDTLHVAMLSFDEIRCEDDADYRCKVVYERNGDFKNVISSSTKVTVTSPPAKPESINTSVPISGISQGHYVSFICTGNVGNPPGNFIWKKHQLNKEPVTYSDIITKTDEAVGSCTYHGTSNLTIQMTDMDNGARVECVEQSLVSAGSMSIMTQAVNVYYKIRNVTIMKIPNMESYKAGHINLTCQSDGNPAPEYSWYKETGTDNIVGTGDMFVITDLNVNKTGTYVCKAYHYINGEMYREFAKVNVTIGNSENSNSYHNDAKLKVLYFVLPIIFLLSIPLSTVLIYFFRKRQNNRPNDKKNIIQSTGGGSSGYDNILMTNARLDGVNEGKRKDSYETLNFERDSSSNEYAITGNCNQIYLNEEKQIETAAEINKYEQIDIPKI